VTAFASASEGIVGLPQVSRERRYLHPGNLFVAAKPTAITTVLGSCVAVCLWDPKTRIGGMNHFILPNVAGGGAASPRFGNVAMEQLVTKVRGANGRLPFLRARVFGGACMFEHFRTSEHLGQQNATIAVDYLSRCGIEVVQIDVGGNRGRKLVFHTDEGTACLTMI
jgi:chemotaxis protein CheD